MSQTRIRVGVLGLTHDHIWSNLDRLIELEGAELVAAAEPEAALRDQFRARYGDRPTSDTYAALLDGRHSLQALLIFADNRASAEWGAIAAEQGLHVMLEKPMASTLALANRMAAAARRSQVQLMINWPHHWNPSIRTAYRLVADGAVGEVFKLRYFGGHGGPREIGCSPIFCDWLYDADRNGVGALTDQGGYAATICRWFLGQPQRVMAMGGRLTKDDIADLDNVVMLLRYPRAIGVAEASWSWIGGLPAPGPTIWGQTGSLVTQGGREAAGVTLIKQGEREPTFIPADPLPEGERNAPEYFITAIMRERPIEGLVSATISRDAQEILAAAIRSIESGAEVALPLDRALPGVSTGG